MLIRKFQESIYCKAAVNFFEQPFQVFLFWKYVKNNKNESSNRSNTIDKLLSALKSWTNKLFNILFNFQTSQRSENKSADISSLKIIFFTKNLSLEKRYIIESISWSPKTDTISQHRNTLKFLIDCGERCFSRKIFLSWMFSRRFIYF